jgi:predicted dehydrogenase
MTSPLKVGVVGGGLIAQAVHLPNLAKLSDDFAVVGIADVSPRVAGALGRKYAARAYTDWRRLIERERLDAVLVCSPPATHVEVTLAALECNLAVFVEKPLCLDPVDARRICRRAAESGAVVQVGYMKRFSATYEALLEALPTSADQLRLISVTTYDPWMAREPFVRWDEMVRGADVPPSVVAAQDQSHRDQVEAAVGHCDTGTARAYGYTFLSCLIHDVNLVHGALDRLAVKSPMAPLMATAWAEGAGGSIGLELPTGAVAHFAWVLLPGCDDFREQATFYFEDAVHEVCFGAPYDREAPSVYRVTRSGESRTPTEVKVIGDPFLAELRHFHECVVGATRPRCPPEQGARDVALLRDAFVAGQAARGDRRDRGAA